MTAHLPHLPRLLAAAALALALPAVAADCADIPFVDSVPAAAWVTLDVAPAQGTAGVRDALRQAQQQHPAQPVRIRLAPGTYADNLGAEIYAQALWRSAQAPLWLVATDANPDATVLGHGINLVGVSWVAIDGVTIGPAQVGAWNGNRHANPQPLQAAAGVHVSGVAQDGQRSALRDGQADLAIYGRWQPSHHLLVRRVTVQNLFDPAERDGESSDSQSMDGMKFNQVQDLWVLDSRVSQTTRHGIDNVGVHRAAFCRNVVSGSGGGLGIEAKGGSVDVLYDGNLFHRVRRVELGGEDTDATYYFSADGRWDYEGLRITARNNLIVDPREAALEFSGCRDCAAVNNTVYFSPGYRAPQGGGDAIRIHDSRTLAAADGAGSDCITWDVGAQDYVTVDRCWGLGAQAPAPVNRVLRSSGTVLANNLLLSHAPLWGVARGDDAVACTLNAAAGAESPRMDGNLWFNGGQPLPTDACSTRQEGTASALAAALPVTGGSIDGSTLARLASGSLQALQPLAGGVLPSLAAATMAPVPALDHQRGPRNAAGHARRGALAAPAGSEAALADRLFNWAERSYPLLFGPAAGSQPLAGYHARAYPLSGHHVGTRGGRLYVLGPGFGPSPVDLGPAADWLPRALQAGF
jgi:hypothetical protein